MKTHYFAQHGMALSEDKDEKRSLSAQGIEETQTIARYLKKQQIEISQICHSGKLRALQTADIFAEVLQVELVVPLEGVKPGDPALSLIQQLEADNVLYVGHLPNIQKVVSTLICHEDTALVRFQNSAVICLEMNESESMIK